MPGTRLNFKNYFQSDLELLKDHLSSLRLMGAINFFFLGVISFALAGYAIFNNNQSSLLLLGVIFLIGSLMNGVAAIVQIKIQLLLRLVMILLAVNFSLIAFAGLISDGGIYGGLLILIYSIIISTTTTAGRISNAVILQGILMASVAVMISVFQILPSTSLPSINTIAAIVTGLIVAIYLILLITKIIASSLSVRFLNTMLVIALVPLVPISYLLINTTRTTLEERNNEVLNLAANQTATNIDQFLLTAINNTVLDSSLPVFISYLDTAPDTKPDAGYINDVALTIQTMSNVRRQSNLVSYALLDETGINVFDTETTNIGKLEGLSESVRISTTANKVYISPTHYDSVGRPVLIFMNPIRNLSGELIGILKVTYNALALQSMLQSSTGMFGTESYPILIDEYQVRLADVLHPDQVYLPITPLTESEMQELSAANRLSKTYTSKAPDYYLSLASALRDNPKGVAFSVNVEGINPEYPEAVIALQLKNAPWRLIFIQNQSILFSTVNNQRNIALTIATVIAAIVSILALFITGFLNDPITRLTATAQKMASGDLNVSLEIKDPIEISTLSDAFNTMAKELRTIVGELEDRVRTRTQELASQNEFLQFRTRQLQTVSDVARNIATEMDLESLLNRVSELISDRFNFYHVGIFLVDENKEYAVLRAANSDGGKRMLARHHRLRVGQVGMVGYVTGAGKPRIATDVGEDAVHFKNPDLPITKSEMSIPLIVGEEVIGALDVQSVEVNAFTDQDIELFTTLADQVAIAIENSRLYTEASSSLREVELINRRYLQQQWGQELLEHPHYSYLYTPQGITSTVAETSVEIESMFKKGEPVFLHTRNGKKGKNQKSILAVPIKIRDEVIGYIQMQESTEIMGGWGEDELRTVNDIADQIGQALENARLFEKIIRRAEREQKALEITSKIRSANDVQTMLQIASQELQSVLRANRAQIVLQKTGETAGDGTNKLPPRRTTQSLSNRQGN
jgi:GAF domain-containing protein/HAMP domain-containing protein